MTLKEKLFNAVFDNAWEFKTENVIPQCEKIAEEFAIGFAEWLTNEKSKYAILYGNQEKRFATFEEDYTSKELLEIYKDEKGL